MDSHIGFVTAGDDLLIPLLTRTPGTLIVASADAAPSYVIYDSDGLNQVVAGGSGPFALRHSGTVTGCVTSGGLIKITTPTTHGLVTGQVVDVASVGGVAAATGTWPITVVNSTSFTLNGSTFSGVYTSGGTWHVTGLYVAVHEIDEAEYVAGKTYQIVCTYLNDGDPMVEVLYFTVV